MSVQFSLDTECRVKKMVPLGKAINFMQEGVWA